MTLEMLLRSVFLPGLIACGMSALAAAVLYAGRPTQVSVEDAAAFVWRDWVGRLLLGLGFGAAFVVAFVMTEGWIDWPPHSRWQWLLVIGAWGGVVGGVAGVFRDRWWCTLLTGLALGVPVGWMLEPLPIVEQPLLWRIGLGVTVALLYISLAVQGARRRGGWMPLALMIAFTAGSFVMIEARFAKLGLITAAMAASCGGALVIGLWARRMAFSPGPAAVVAATLPTLAMLGWFYNEGSVAFAAFGLLALSPFVMWLAEWPMVNRRSMIVRVLVWIGLIAIVAATAAVLSMRTSEEQRSPYDYYARSVMVGRGWEMHVGLMRSGESGDSGACGCHPSRFGESAERNALRRNACGWSLHFACWFSVESLTDVTLSY